MTREEARAIIRKEYLCVDRDCDIERSCGKCDLMMPSKEPILQAYKMAIRALEQEPKTGHWIPVSERLPENDGRYLVENLYDGEPSISISIRSFTKDLNKVDEFDFPKHKSGWYDYDSEYGYWEDTKVIAWMPLPKPYEPQESEEQA